MTYARNFLGLMMKHFGSFLQEAVKYYNKTTILTNLSTSDFPKTAMKRQSNILRLKSLAIFAVTQALTEMLSVMGTQNVIKSTVILKSAEIVFPAPEILTAV